MKDGEKEAMRDRIFELESSLSEMAEEKEAWEDEKRELQARVDKLSKANRKAEKEIVKLREVNRRRWGVAMSGLCSADVLALEAAESVLESVADTLRPVPTAVSDALLKIARAWQVRNDAAASEAAFKKFLDEQMGRAG